MKYFFNPMLRYFHLQNEEYVLDLLNEEYYSTEILYNELIFEILKITSNKPCNKNGIVAQILSLYEIDKDLLFQFLEQLIEEKLLLSESDYRKEWLDLQELWKTFNWNEAYVYQLFNNAKKKLDYSQSGYEIDIEGMREFKREKNPPPIYKEYDSKQKRVRLKEVATISTTNFSVRDVMMSKKAKSSKINFDQLSYLLKMVFGRQGIKTTSLGDEYLLKTSPSGGIKHPTECYLITTNNIKLSELSKNSVYHYSVYSNNLVEINNLSEIDLKKVCPLIKENSNDYPVIIILTSIFERSMYRYRESRSFKAVNIDVGHLLSSATLILDSLNISYNLSHSTSFEYVNSLLNIDGLKEASICYIAIK
ncbi:SagB/ThcOx family dehydrogenase [Anoxybacillus sp. FSL W8-1294]|uniref:SagB/ThcOx family dehydrogenase n=1 Tax=Anoxybacillus sp. FSL W8-1294 TaxID=2954655 RepID=UPI0030D305E7